MPTIQPHPAEHCETVVAQLIDMIERAYMDDAAELHHELCKAVLVRVATLTAALAGGVPVMEWETHAPVLDDHQPDEVPAVNR